MPQACPCNPFAAYAACCQPLHEGRAPARDAEALMRSRYSAYVFGLRDYLLATWHPDTRPAALDLDDSPDTKWLGLDVKRHVDTGDGSAVVEFVARYKEGGAPAVRMHEVSRFLRVDGMWLYVDGEFPGKRRMSSTRHRKFLLAMTRLLSASDRVIPSFATALRFEEWRPPPTW